MASKYSIYITQLPNLLQLTTILFVVVWCGFIGAAVPEPDEMGGEEDEEEEEGESYKADDKREGGLINSSNIGKDLVKKSGRSSTMKQQNSNTYDEKNGSSSSKLDSTSNNNNVIDSMNIEYPLLEEWELRGKLQVSSSSSRNKPSTITRK